MFEMPAKANGARAWRVVAKDFEKDHIPPFDLCPKAWLGNFVSASWAVLYVEYQYHTRTPESQTLTVSL
jgi:hypothetical protein